MYFEICAAMGNEPVEEEIPVDFEDFYTDVQEAFLIYSKLKDVWDGFSGSYLGKNFAGIKDIFEILEVPREDWKSVFDLINLIDHYRSEHIRKELDTKRSSKNPS